jgi:hypothetical protein
MGRVLSLFALLLLAVSLSDLTNDLLKKEIAIIETAK